MERVRTLTVAPGPSGRWRLSLCLLALCSLALRFLWAQQDLPKSWEISTGGVWVILVYWNSSWGDFCPQPSHVVEQALDEEPGSHNNHGKHWLRTLPNSGRVQCLPLNGPYEGGTLTTPHTERLNVSPKFHIVGGAGPQIPAVGL